MEWIYENNEDNSCRYALGVKGNNVLFVFGINPSTAEPNKLDPTLRKVKSIAEHNNYDGWVMLNVYPVRETQFEKLPEVPDVEETVRNVKSIMETIGEEDEIDIWVAFGDLIDQKEYLLPCWKKIMDSIDKKEIRWFVTALNKTGAPRHPLYQRNDCKLIEFDMKKFLLNKKNQ